MVEIKAGNATLLLGDGVGLQAAFDETYFNTLSNEGKGKLSLKAFLATEQRIPGLGNRVLQDILSNAKMHLKKKVNTLRRKTRKTVKLTQP